MNVVEPPIVGRRRTGPELSVTNEKDDSDLGHFDTIVEPGVMQQPVE